MRLPIRNSVYNVYPAQHSPVEVHCGTGYKNNLRELIEYIVPPVKGAVVDNGKITYITV
jgi:hypothetical protein